MDAAIHLQAIYSSTFSLSLYSYLAPHHYFMRYYILHLYLIRTYYIGMLMRSQEQGVYPLNSAVYFICVLTRPPDTHDHAHGVN